MKKDINEKITVTTPQQCHREFDLLKATLLLEETEDSWLKIDASIKRFTAAVRGGACDFPEDFIRRWKDTDIVRGLVGALSTERTRLSGSALDLIGSTARLSSYWDSAIPFYIPTIIKLLARASKIYVTRASIALNTLIRGTRSAAMIPLLLDGLSDKSITLRVGCADALLCCLGGSPERDRDQIESIDQPTVHRDALNKRISDIEMAIKIGGRDRDPKVRAIFKRIWELYQKLWPARAISLSQPFTPTIKRYLGLGKGSGSSQPPSNPQPLASNRSVPQSSTNLKRAGHERTHQPSSSRDLGTLPLKTDRPHSAASNHTRSTAPAAHHRAPDSETLRLAASVPLPPDHPLQPVRRQTRLQPESAPVSTNYPPLTSNNEARPGIKKRSNSTMRAQRVALPVPDPNAGTSHTRTATRVPFNPLLTNNHLQPEVFPKPGGANLGHSNLTHKQANLSHHTLTHKQPTSITHESDVQPPGGASASIRSFKPSRTASGSSQAIPATAPPSSTLPPTRPLPRRAAPEPSEAVNLKKSVGPSTNINRTEASENQINLSSARKAFKPSKAPKPMTKTGPAFKPTKSTTTSVESAPTVTSTKTATSSSSVNLTLRPATSSLPEGLRIAASIPLPPSPTFSESPSPEPNPRPAAPNQLPEPTTTSHPVLVPSEGSLPIQKPNPPPESKSVCVKGSTCEDLEPQQNVDLSPQSIISTSNVERTRADKPTSRSQPSTAAQMIPVPRSPPKGICTQLPHDLIVPMSVPLPPSPNSPYLFKNQTSRFPKSRPPKPTSSRQPGNHSPRKPNFTTTTPRKHDPITPRTRRKPLTDHSSTVVSSEKTLMKCESLSKSVSVVSGKKELNHGSPRPASSQGHRGSGGATQLLVDFEHEDTIWMPPTPKLNSDLAELGPVFEFGQWRADDESEGGKLDVAGHEVIGSEDEGVDGPEETKRMRFDSGPITDDESTPTKIRPTSPPSPVHHRRRDPSIFHWDREGELDDEIMGDTSGEKTVSCLKEQPMFLGGDVTVNGSFDEKEFLIGIEARNQSTPAASVPISGIGSITDRTRFALGNLSLSEE